jgi:hypothetical protein
MLRHHLRRIGPFVPGISFVLLAPLFAQNFPATQDQYDATIFEEQQ